jgi:outer membrane lipopolysaccharide assembly protein LptE/RlpB
MVEELAMVSVLAGMGIYFVKSTDLPKDLKERSRILETENARNQNTQKSKIYSPSISTESKTVAKDEIDLTLKKIQEERILKDYLASIDNEISLLTLKITSLEQEIKDNNERNVIIQNEIDQNLKKLDELNKKRLS